MTAYNVAGKIVTDEDIKQADRAFYAMIVALSSGIDALRTYQKALDETVVAMASVVADLRRFLKGID